jgi:hypothetical protein
MLDHTLQVLGLPLSVPLPIEKAKMKRFQGLLPQSLKAKISKPRFYPKAKISPCIELTVRISGGRVGDLGVEV